MHFTHSQINYLFCISRYHNIASRGNIASRVLRIYSHSTQNTNIRDSHIEHEILLVAC